MNVVDKDIQKCKKRIQKNACPWITDEIIDFMKKRNNVLLAAAKREEDSVLWDAYKRLKNRVNHLMKERRKEYYSNLILQNHNNSKKVWKCLKDIIPKSADISRHTINVNKAQ